MELYQRAKSGEQRHFELKAERELHVTISRAQLTSHYGFSVLALMDRGKRIYTFRKRWLYLGILTILAMSFLPQLEMRLGFNIHTNSKYIFAGLFCLSLLFLLLLARSFKRHYVYLSIHTRLPIVEMWVNNPNRKEFINFIHELEKAIQSHKAKMQIPFNRQLAGEMRTLRRVSEAGVISPSVYQAAKAKLLIMSDQNYRPSPNSK